MEQYKKQWPIEEMARMLGVARSGYYKHCKKEPSKRQKENEILQQTIRTIFKMSRQTYGSPRVHAELKAQGFKCSRPRVARIMRQEGIAAKMRRLFKRTTRVDGRRAVAPNLLQQEFSAPMPNRKWVADITYVRTQEGWLYVAIVLDLFSRKVVGLAMGESLHAALVLQAMKQALQRRRPKSGLQHHSDRGCQYTGELFQLLLIENGITCSMSGTGNCYDNAVAESFFHTLKTECIHFERYESRKQAMQSIFEYVEVFYNNQRRHSTLGYVSPAEFERHFNQPHCS
jgi:transposase InsO family protein